MFKTRFVIHTTKDKTKFQELYNLTLLQLKQAKKEVQKEVQKEDKK